MNRRPRRPYPGGRSGGCRPRADDGGAGGEHHRGMSPTEIRVRLLQLTAERLDAMDAGLTRDAAYMADLEGEVTVWRQAYVGAAVTEIASLRGELFGRNMG